MVSEGPASVHMSQHVGGLPWIGVVPICIDDLDRLRTFLMVLKQNAVMQGFHVCFVGDESAADRIAVELGATELDSSVAVIAHADGANHVAAIADVMGRYPGRDIVLLSTEAILPFAWDARLHKGAYAEPRIAAATSLCDVSPMFALVNEALAPGTTLDPITIDRTAYSMGDRNYYEVPRVHPICTYFRRDALDATLTETSASSADATPTLVEFVKQMRTQGWSCVLCDFLYVGIARHRDRAPAKDSVAAFDDVEESAFRQQHPLGSLRRSVADAIATGITSVSVPGLDSRPVQLHIMHFWGGGLDKWVRDFGRADPSRINLVFSSFRIGGTGGQRLVLYSDPVDPNPIRIWDIAQPIQSTLSTSIEYRKILEQIVREFEVEAIIVSSLIGHTLDAVDQPVKTIVVCHDFYPVCQAINPQFGKTCERCTLDDLRLCAKSNPLNSIFIDQSSSEWHAMRGLYVEKLLANKIGLVVPSPSVERTLKRISPRMQGLDFHLIPHGIDMNVGPLPVATRAAGEPLRLVVLGRLSLHKGTELLRAACDALKPFAQITLVGCGGNGVKLAQACGWEHIEKYESADLPAILQKLAPHAGLLASVMPETFSYTLSELNLLGVPTLATALGSFNDRIVDGESGFLYQPTPEALVELVRRLYEQPNLLTKVAQTLHSTSQHRGVADMISDYRALIPSAPRPVARFRVGVGMQTGLTEPYRHLTEAYTHLTGAYEHTKLAYVAATADQKKLAELTSTCDRFVTDLDALNLRKRWWRVSRVLDLLEVFRTKLQKFKDAEAKKQDEATENSP